jgi:hypothetical protein
MNPCHCTRCKGKARAVTTIRAHTKRDKALLDHVHHHSESFENIIVQAVSRNENTLMASGISNYLSPFQVLINDSEYSQLVETSEDIGSMDVDNINSSMSY